MSQAKRKTEEEAKDDEPSDDDDSVVVAEVNEEDRFSIADLGTPGKRD